jgi:hypothetical protein
VLSRGRLPPPDGAEHLVADRSDPEALAAALAGRSFDAVIDNVAMTAAHVEEALEALGGRTGHYVLTSTASVYGDFSRGRVWRESDLRRDELERAPGRRQPVWRSRGKSSGAHGSGDPGRHEHALHKGGVRC